MWNNLNDKLPLQMSALLILDSAQRLISFGSLIIYVWFITFENALYSSLEYWWWTRERERVIERTFERINDWSSVQQCSQQQNNLVGN